MVADFLRPMGRIGAVMSDDEWGPEKEEAYDAGVAVEEKSTETETEKLKKALVDSFYGTDRGLKATSETRAEIVELITQLEAKNPNPAPTDMLTLLNGKWILATHFICPYYAENELYPQYRLEWLLLAFAKSMSSELDFVQEARTSEIGAKISRNSKMVRIHDVFWDLTTRLVSTMQFYTSCTAVNSHIRVAKDNENAKIANEKASKGQQMLSSPWDAAKHMESAAAALAKDVRHWHWQEVVDFYQRGTERGTSKE